MIEFTMPSLGADMEDGTLREWLVKPGDRVKRGDIIAVVETQKGLIDIEVFEEGIIDSIIIKVDEKVPVGTVLAHIATQGEVRQVTAPEKASVAEPRQAPMAKEIPRIKASPLARRMASEHGIDLATIHGSGELGGITSDDVQKAISQMAPVPAFTTTAASAAVRMAVAAAMSRSNREIPHYYLQTTIDMSKALEWLSDCNRDRMVTRRLLPVVLYIKAVAKSLREVPQLNAWWQDGLQLKSAINTGIAVSLRGGGVMIPAIHEADRKSLDELMDVLNDIIPRARSLKLRSSDLSDSTITITSLGDDAAELVYGVIYPPQVALIGFGAIVERPWAEKGMLAVRRVLTVTLAADHRATDGITGSRFLMAVNKHLQQPALL